jgi:transcriptional regulator with PAS, ATPase and Fis domain
MTAESARRNRWPALFQQATQPCFVLSAAKRIRFVNAAWEAVTGIATADAVGRACLRRGPTADVFRTLAPTPEASKGLVSTARRAVPPKGLGPPWWDVTFVPLKSADGVGGFLGLISVVPSEMHGVKAHVPASVAAVRDAHGRQFTIDLVTGTGPGAERFANQVRHAAHSAAPLWLTGEPGSGKETVARVVHHTGPRRDKAFFGVDCAGTPGFLLDAILFGRGSAGESGRLGTIYLKNPAAFPRDVQRHLAAWLSGPGAAVRVICGGRESAAAGVANGSLVPEFESQYAVLELRVPPLRERTTELPHVVTRLLARHGSRTVSPEALETLAHYPWPGNLRELDEVLADAAGDGPVKPEHLPRFVRERAALVAAPPQKAEPGPKLDDVLAEVEKRLLCVALSVNHGNATRAADWLGVARTRFVRRAEALGVKGGAETA